MELRMLNPEYVQQMTGKDGQKIYLVEFSRKYVEELLARYKMEEYLAGVLCDTTDRMSGSVAKGSREVIVRGVSLPVYPYTYFCELGEDASFIILSDYFRECFDKLYKQGDGGVRKDGVGKTVHTRHPYIYYFADRETEIELSYRELYQNRHLENLIVFRSGPHASSYVKGMDYGDNARALFEYMLEEGCNCKYELVWLVKNPSEYAYISEEYENVRFLSFDWSVSEEKQKRDAYYRALCLAKYIFMTDAYGFCRNARKDQIRVQLWHGCGFKTRINFTRCEKRYEYNIVVSEVYKKIHQEIYGLREDQVLVTGYPKNDWLFHPDTDWKKKLNVPEAGHYIFWLPTFRRAVGQLEELDEKAPEGQTGLPIVRTMEELGRLDGFLKAKDAVLIIKLHPFQDISCIYQEGMANIVLLDNGMLVEKNLQINQILCAADGLISDYSSAAVDYLLLDRPLAFTLDDVEAFERSRGFVFDPIRDWLPGNEIYSYEEFTDFIGDVAEGRDKNKRKRRILAGRMHRFFDDRSSKRVLDALGI